MGLESRVTALEEKQENYDKVLNGIEGTVNLILKDQIKVNSRLDKMENRMDKMENRMELGFAQQDINFAETKGYFIAITKELAKLNDK